MMKIAFVGRTVAAAALSLALAACESPTPPDTQNPPPVIQPDKDCTHGDGKPC